MTGDTGPYMNDDGDVWVPRTVPYLEARRIAKEAMSWDFDRLVYVGKTDTTLFGFARDCRCEEACAIEVGEDDGKYGPGATCRVPAWAFRVVEP